MKPWTFGFVAAVVFGPIAASADLDWQTCKVNEAYGLTKKTITDYKLTCSTLEVPLNYTYPDGEQIKIAVVRRPAPSGPGKKIGTVITNPGGPGASGIQDLATGVDLYGSVFASHFDQVSFDPRGIGLSEPLIDCHAAADELNGANPETPQGFEQVMDAIRKMWRQCEGNAEMARVLPYLGTVNVVRDLDRLRSAIGEEKLTYVGFSYGTLIGSVYATFFSENIRAMVLDGAMSPHATLVNQGRDSTLADQETLDRLLRECDADVDCHLHGNAREKYNRLLAKLEIAPMPVTINGKTSQLTSGWFITAVADGIALDWQGLTEGIDKALAGDAEPLLRLGWDSVDRSEDGSYDNSNEMYNIVQCLDFPDRPSERVLRGLVKEVLPNAPDLGGYGIRISSPLCLGAKTAPTPVPPVKVENDAPPILVISNLTDPETPYQWGQRLVSAIGSARLLTWDGGGHTVFASDRSKCIDRLTMKYLVDLELPPLATTCPESDRWSAQ